MPCNNQCLQYKAIKETGTRYGIGQKRCQVCDIFINWNGIFCPCCNYRLRSKPRNNKYKDGFKASQIKSNLNVKTKFVGTGKNPNLKIFVDDSYLKMVPRLPYEQFHLLKESISKNGLEEPITVNQDGKILDGHTRYQICSMLHKTVEYKIKRFKTIDDERRYVVSTNLERRQLRPFQIVELTQAIRRDLNKQVREEANEYLSKLRTGKIEPTPKDERLKTSTRYRLAELTGLGSCTIDKANYIIDNGLEHEIELARSGKASLEVVYNKVKNRRHGDPSIQVKRNDRTFPSRSRCGSDTRFVGKCHVHSKYCCKNCEWGV